MKQTGRKPTIRVKSRRHGHRTNLGMKIDESNFSPITDYLGETEYLPLLTKALEGDLTGLLKILNSREKDRLYSYLNSLRRQS